MRGGKMSGGINLQKKGGSVFGDMKKRLRPKRGHV